MLVAFASDYSWMRSLSIAEPWPQEAKGTQLDINSQQRSIHSSRESFLDFPRFRSQKNVNWNHISSLVAQKKQERKKMSHNSWLRDYLSALIKCVFHLDVLRLFCFSHAESNCLQTQLMVSGYMISWNVALRRSSSIIVCPFPVRETARVCRRRCTASIFHRHDTELNHRRRRTFIHFNKIVNIGLSFLKFSIFCLISSCLSLSSARRNMKFNPITRGVL